MHQQVFVKMTSHLCKKISLPLSDKVESWRRRNFEETTAVSLVEELTVVFIAHTVDNEINARYKLHK